MRRESEVLRLFACDQPAIHVSIVDLGRRRLPEGHCMYVYLIHTYLDKAWHWRVYLVAAAF